MQPTLRVLIVEDSGDDAELMALRLAEAGFQLDWQRVETEAGYRAALESAPELILADWNLPGFGGRRALELLTERGLEIPFVIVSGGIGEEAAVEALRAGAADYVWKDRPARLGPAVRRALDDQRRRRQQQQAEQALRESEARFRRLAENASDLIYRYEFEPRRGFTYVSPAATTITGFTPEEHYADPDLGFKLVHPDDRPLLAAAARGELPAGQPLILRWVRKDGVVIWTEQRNVPVRDEAGRLLALEGIARDITERQQADNLLRASEAHLQRQLQRLAALQAIDDAITGSLDLRLTLELVLRETCLQLNVEAASVLLLDRYQLVLEYAASSGFRTSALPQTRLRLGEGWAGQAALERRLISIPDLRGRKTGFLQSPYFSAEQFVAYAAAPLIVKGQVKGVLEIFRRTLPPPEEADEDWRSFFETLAEQTAIAIDNAQLFEGLQQANQDLTLAYDATIEGWSRAMDLRDRETEGHTRRVTDLALRLASALGFDNAALAHLRRGALLHDIGKIGVPDAILNKPGPLTEAEWVIMRQHPQLAHDMLAPIVYLRPALHIPYCHHEHWDGGGYPRGLKGEAIPPAARLFAVVDVWDALTSDRPYRPAWTPAQARDYIAARAGTQFEPRVVAAFLTLIDQSCAG